MKDLENKVEELQKASQAANTENSVLRAQVERLQIELKEYRKRLSWISTGNSIGTASSLYSNANNFRNYASLNNEFTFHFPKFGDLPNQIFGNKGVSATSQSPSPSLSNPSNRTGSLPSGFTTTAGQLTANAQGSPHAHATIKGMPSNNINARNGTSSPQIANHNGVENFHNSKYSLPNGTTFSTNSPSSSSESNNGHISSIATSPEPMVNSPSSGKDNIKTNFRNGEKISDSREEAFYAKLGEACGCADNPIPAALAQSSGQSQTSPHKETTNDVPGFDWLAQQNGGQFDPVLFNDYRDPQDAILTQEFPDFFDDAFPFGENSFNNFGFEDISAPKTDLVGQIDSALAADDEVVPGEDKSQMLTCTKIWLVLPVFARISSRFG